MRSLALAGLVACALVLAGCSDDDPTVRSAPSASPSASFGPAATGPHNDADVAFAQGMVPHHAQAVEMADLALKKAEHADVWDLSAAVKHTQSREIATMSGWLVGWDEDVPQGSAHGGHGMDGMLSADQMKELADSSGAAFDKLWLELMVEHHEGALDMAREELAEGQNPDVKAMAQDVVEAQTKEIATMKALLKTL